MKNVLEHFGLKNKGGNNRTAWERIKLLNLDTSHFMNSVKSSWESRKMTEDFFKEKHLIKNCSTNRGTIKRYLIQFNLIDWKCSSCNNTGIWNGKKLSLQLEHKNGISDDNRLENLCFLCPNCHSQTDTFAGKKLKINKIKKIKKTEKKKTNPHKRKTKIEWPSNNFLQKIVFEQPLLQLSRKLGVSDNAIRKHCFKNNITLPKNGYWQKIYDNLGKWRNNKKLPTVVLPHA
jgi:Zn finger protein HypA/HybF involved in hydrogenase expression